MRLILSLNHWNDTLVKQFIVDQGWAEAGIRDADGSIADLGAIPKGGIPETEMMVKPICPVTINGTTATAAFSLHSLIGTITNPKIKYFTWINDLPFQSNSFAGNFKPFPAENLIKLPIPTTPITAGNNSITFTIPAPDTSQHFAMLEMTIEGEVNGKTITSDVGFLPYRLANNPPTFTIRPKPEKFKNQKFCYEIIDLRGRLIDKIKSDKLSTDASNLLQRSFNIPKGVYIVREISVAGKRMSAERRLIVKR